MSAFSGGEAALQSDVKLAMAGDSDAYRRLVESSSNVVCAIALAIVRNVQASEDVAQEVFLVAWTSLRKLRNPASFLPWLRQITRNQANLWLRRNAREVSAGDLLALTLDSRPGPVDALLRDEERRVLGEVMDNLAEETREVVVLYYREHSSARHVAGLLGISEDAVKQRLSRARLKIREEMFQRFGETMKRTAPGAALVTAVGAALTAAAPPASAAIVGASVAKSAAGSSLLWLAKTAGAGAIIGGLGVLMGFHHLGEPFDEREAKELKVFKIQITLVVIAGSILFPLIRESSPPPHYWKLSGYVAFLAVLSLMNLVRLPKILERRMAWEREVNPEEAKKTRRAQFYGLAGQTVSGILAAMALTMLTPSLFR
jgi:RNA polymerase sigma factor (sigma-70 family)